MVAEHLLVSRAESRGDLPSVLETLAARSGNPEVLFECAVVQARFGDRAAAAGNLERIIEEAKEVPEYLEPNVRPWVKKAEQALKKLAS